MRTGWSNESPQIQDCGGPVLHQIRPGHTHCLASEASLINACVFSLNGKAGHRLRHPFFWQSTLLSHISVFYQKCAPTVQLSKPYLMLSARGEENGQTYMSNKPEQSLTAKRGRGLIALPVEGAPALCGQWEGKRREGWEGHPHSPFLAFSCSSHVWQQSRSTEFTLVWRKASSTSFNRSAQTEGRSRRRSHVRKWGFLNIWIYRSLDFLKNKLENSLPIK